MQRNRRRRQSVVHGTRIRIGMEVARGLAYIHRMAEHGAIHIQCSGPVGRGRIMRNRRFQFGDRRMGKPMPRIPFKDSDGATIKACRRKIPDRRTGNIRVSWIDMRC